ncbi:MAG: PfkB family carbohydrate kinase [Fastidiosipilaceae bacterium]|jgi:2-dehydro-3-deoxygluconokinase
MELNLKDASACRYDAVSLGEVMLRLDPGDNRIRNARQFTAWEGGGEYNVIRGLRRCFGMRTAVVTALADNDIGWLIEDFILQGGVDTRWIHWEEFDGIGRTSRNGLNFTERGFGVRGARGISDRAYTAISNLKPGDIDWEKLFGEYGVRWFHTGGICAALSATTAEVVIEALEVAKKYGTITSYDLNYRPSLWNAIGGQEKCQAVNKRIAPLIDVMIGNEEDFTACLGFEIEGADEHLKELDTDSYKKMLQLASETYPNFKAIGNSLRTVHTASDNDWSGLIYCDGVIHKAKQYDHLEIFDRIGGGDSFASGIIYGLMTTGDPEIAVNYGAAHGALAMTTPGDTTTARKSEVEALMGGGSARVQR